MSNRKNSMRGFIYGEEGEGSEQNLPVSLIVLPEYQPRSFFDDDKLEELARNIKARGIISRLVVRRLVGTDKYELVAGGRRFRAALKAGLTEVPVVVKKLTDEEALALAITENLQREDLNPVEETEGIIRLLALETRKPKDEIAGFLNRMYNESKRKPDSDQNVLVTDEAGIIRSIFDELATISWESFVTSRLPLLNLPEDILEPLRKGEIEYTKAKALARLEDGGRRAELLQDTIDKNLSLTQIKERVDSLDRENDSSAANPTPAKAITDVSRKLRKAQLWKKDPKKWRKAQTLLKKLEELLDDDASEDTSEPA
jgi:ParB family transcriptional regulator, chromosome partitioning protein